MLDGSFVIFPGVGLKTEKRIWSEGVLDWRSFIKARKLPGLSGARKSFMDELARDAMRARESEDYGYFGELLSGGESWRLWPELRDEAVCFDIETDGLPAPIGSLTVAGFYSHGEYRAYVQGINLSREAIEAELSQARLMVSFFGNGFDLPFIRASYPGIRADAVHFDLCPAGHRVGLRGGLKKVERMLGIQRGDDVAGMDGYEAVLMWKAYLSGRKGALDRLVEYNREDTVNLHTLADVLYGKLRADSGFPGPYTGM